MKQQLFILLFLFAGFSCAAQPQIKGGLEAFVRNNTVYPSYSLQNCIEGQVKVAFKLTSKGEVFESSVQSGIGTDLDDEALRLIRLSSGKWNIPQGNDSTVLLVVPINFKLQDYGCGNKSKQEILQAINAYKVTEGLTNTVLNFYRNKEKGTYTASDEPRILSIKKELGYDEEYMQQRVKDGMKKVKQKDLQGACEDFRFVKDMGSDLADDALKKYCK